MSVKEKKTSAGNPFAIIKFSDLSKVFELFIFSEMLENNRNNLTEGKSFLLTVIKDLKNQDNRFKRINVSKILLLKDLINKPISNIKLTLNNLKQISFLDNLEINGDTAVTLTIKNNNRETTFKLNKNRKVDRKTLNILKKEGISTQIN